MKILNFRLALSLALSTAALAANAGVTLYADPVAWQAAVSGLVTPTETFDTDYPDLSSTTPFNGFTLKALGTYRTAATNAGSLGEYVDGDSGDKLLLTPFNNAYGFAGEFGNFTGGGEGASALLHFTGGGTASFDIQSVIGGGGGLANRFFGLVSTERFSTLELIATNPDGNIGNGESFSADNFRIAAPRPVPEPATMAALGMGALAFVKRRKRA